MMILRFQVIPGEFRSLGKRRRYSHANNAVLSPIRRVSVTRQHDTRQSYEQYIVIKLHGSAFQQDHC